MIVLANVAVISACALALWAVAVRRGDPSFIDACWGFGFVVIAWLSFAVADDRSRRSGWVVALVTLWGVRLGGYLFWRWRRNGPDARYESMLRHSAHPARDMLTKVFALQAVLMLVVSLPVMIGFAHADSTGPRALHLLGVVLALVGLAFEWTADFQLVRFKARRESSSDVMDRGLWRFSRHPNYFGDFCFWWGVFFLSLSAGATYAAIIGPLVMSVLLMRVSGVGPLEKQLSRTKPKYQDYVRRTSAFFPAPPRMEATNAVNN